MRCPGCGAANPDTATFCGQCYDRFDADADADAPADAPASAAWAATSSVAPPASASDARAAEEPADVGSPTDGGAPPLRPVAVGRFAAAAEGLSWRCCALCETSHPLGVFVCTVCGAKMDAEAADAADGPVDWARARRLEAAVPGLGHLGTGHSGMGAAPG